MSLRQRSKRKSALRTRNRLSMEQLEARQLLAGDTIVMFNDHVRGGATDPNATDYAANKVASGLLKDIDTGDETGITLTTSAQGVSYELITLPPNQDTDAYNIFDDFVFMSVGSGAGIKIPDGASYTHTFTGLDPNSTYEFVGTGIRGDSNAVDRWTHIELDSALAFSIEHSQGPGLITDGLSDNQAALHTGNNRDGLVVRWGNIRPGADGEFSIVSTKYNGPTPGFGDGDASSGSLAYGIEAIRLTEFKPNLKVIASTISDGDVLPSSPVDVTMDFSSDIDAGTIDAGDLLIDGLSAPSVTIVDADTLRFDLPANLAPGAHTISIPVGSMTNVPLGIEVQSFDATFDVLGAPTAINRPVTNLTPIQAEIGAEVSNDGGDDPALTIYWGDNDGGTNAGDWDNAISVGTHTTDSGASRLIESLTELTTYYYRAYAENRAGSDWADATTSFTTPEVQLPAIANGAPTSVTSGSARLNGVVSETGGEPPMITVVYGTTDGGTITEDWDFALEIGARDGNYSQFVNGLDAETQYYFSAFATNTAGTVWAPSALTFTTPEPTPQAIVINELHVNPDVKTELVEYVELYNAGQSDTDMSGWALSDGVQFTFPEGTILEAGGYLVVSQDPTAVMAKYGVESLGPFAGQLSNEGERVALSNALTEVQDAVDYQLGFPWPTVGDEPGYSMELINPLLDNDLGGSWRSSGGSTDAGETYFTAMSEWRYFKGSQEPSPAVGAWREIGFDDTSWLIGTGAIGYGDGHVVTNVSDMRNNFTTLYLRKEFTVADANTIEALLLQAQFDDGINVWINGTHVVSDNVSGTDLPNTATASGAKEAVDFLDFEIPNASRFLVDGTNVIAVQLLNTGLNSSDAWFDGQLTQSFGGAGGVTPGARNSVFADNAAPQIRQVNHSPQTPAGGDEVLVTAKVTDPDGVSRVDLEYQLVAPGEYISDSSPGYLSNWTSLPMRDDGMGGDETAGDGTFTVTMPDSLQVHRQLVRYRITVADTTGLSVLVPYADDPSPNFAYFVYDGVPDWTGSARPGTEPDVTYGSDLLNSVATYHLLTTTEDHRDALFLPPSTRSSGYTGSDYLWEGTLIYDGEVYDHIRYRARGGVWRYAMGKNMWKFDFNRGHGFQARDDYGRKYKTTWDKLNFSALIQQGDFNHRGEQGLFESVGFKMFNLTGVEGPYTNYVGFRLITSADEFGEDQYSGDFQGLYMAIEQPDGRMLDEHGLPDGNLYKMEAGTGDLNNQGLTQPSDKSDLNAFLAAESGTRPEQFWRDTLDLEKYYSYRAIVEAIHHYDIANDKNYFYYNNPETGLWEVHPWDLDLTWANNMFGSGNEPFKSRVADRTEFRAEYRNRMREVRDLLYNTDQGYQLIDEMSSFVYTPGEPSLVDADRAMWDYNPIMQNSRYVNSNKSRQGRYYQIASTKDYEGMKNILKNYIVSRGNYIDNTILDDDAEIPDTPQLTYNGPADFALNELRFSTSAIAGGVGEFDAMKWRIAEITDPSNPNYDPKEPVHYEITPTWESDDIRTFDDQMTIPATNLNEGDSYRVRVRLKNSEGYWSHWSEPIQFIAGTATESDLVDHLRVSEIMYNPAPPSVTEIGAGFIDNDSFEYVELANNSSDTMLDLSGVAFTDGIEFSFPIGTMLPAGERVLVVRDTDAFLHRYGNESTIAGEFNSGLSNGGERLRVEGPTAGEIIDFSYSDGDLWPQAADGVGASLEWIDLGAGVDLQGKHYQWQSSAAFGGSPGTDNGVRTGVVINEILAHTLPSVDQSDAIELLNTTDFEIDISGWYLSDAGGDLLKYEIPAGTLLAAGEYVVFDESDFNPTPLEPGERDFALSSTGDDVWLVVPDGNGGVATIVDDVHFRDTLNGQTMGRIPEGSGELFPLGRSSLGCSGSQPLVSPVIVSEVHYNPSTSDPDEDLADMEFVEIFNTTGQPIDLTGWRIRGGVDFDFADGQLIAANEAIAIASFNVDDPTNADQVAAFRARNASGDSILLGGYGGQLSDSGESIRLEMPGPAPVDDPTNVPHVTVDQVTYDDRLPWATDADGLGKALNRISPSFFGSTPSSWTPSSPSAGRFSFAAPGNDLNNDGSVDSADLDLLASVVDVGMDSTVFDIDGNGVVDSQDVAAMAQALGGRPGDSNLDGVVDAVDLNRVGINWLTSNCATWERGDFNGDGSVDVVDLNVLGVNWLQVAAADAARVPRAPLTAIVDPGPAPAMQGLRALSISDSHSDDVQENPDLDRELGSRKMRRTLRERRWVVGTEEGPSDSYEADVDDLLANWDRI